MAAGILYDRQNRVLIAQRPEGKHLPGTWEFPGGKLEPGEDAAAALARELHEEAGVTVSASEPLLTLTYRYPEKAVRLLIRTVTDWSGRPEGREGQALRWIAPDALAGLKMPAGNRPIARMLGMPPYLSISPDPTDFFDLEAFLADWERRAASGYLLQLRAHSLSAKETADCTDSRGLYPLLRSRRSAGAGKLRPGSGGALTLRELAMECGCIARARGARWLLNGPPEVAREAGADGIHLPGWRLKQLRERPLKSDFIVSAACHSRDDVRRAAALALDFVTVSPVCETASHPERADIGYDGLERICRDSPLPVYALGGLGPDDLARTRETGAFGVAGIRAFG